MKVCWFCGCSDYRACPGGCSWIATEKRPACSNCPTSYQLVALEALHQHGTLRSMIQAAGASKSSTQLGADYCRRLLAKGLVEARFAKGFARRYRLTERGLRAIGLRPCERCAGTGCLPLRGPKVTAPSAR